MTHTPHRLRLLVDESVTFSQYVALCSCGWQSASSPYGVTLVEAAQQWGDHRAEAATHSDDRSEHG